MAEEGGEVVLMSPSFTLPQRCAACGAPPQTTCAAKASKRVGRTTYTRSFPIPYCGACDARDGLVSAYRRSFVRVDRRYPG